MSSTDFPRQNPPAFQFYADDFYAGTMDLSQAETGAYIRLLASQWSKGFLPNELPKLERIAGGPVSDDVLLKIPVCEDGLRRNSRMESERAKQTAYRENQSKRGIAGAEARWHKHCISNGVSMPEPLAQPSFSQWPQDGSPSPSPSSELKTEGAKRSGVACPTSVGPTGDRKWLESLKANPAYAGIDIDREAGKCQVWCDVNRATFSKRRFVNWLNRIDKPMVALNGSGHQSSAPLTTSERQRLASIDSDLYSFKRQTAPDLDQIARRTSEIARLESERAALLKGRTP